MPPFTVTFYKDNGKLTRIITIGTDRFTEQFDPGGWYGYFGRPFQKITESEAIALALSILQKRDPNYKNTGRARLELYKFDLLHFPHQLQLVV